MNSELRLLNLNKRQGIFLLLFQRIVRSKLLKDDHDKLFNKDKELKEEKLKLKVYYFL